MAFAKLSTDSLSLTIIKLRRVLLNTQIFNWVGDILGVVIVQVDYVFIRLEFPATVARRATAPAT
jgi:hypothetical protein